MTGLIIIACIIATLAVHKAIIRPALLALDLTI